MKKLLPLFALALISFTAQAQTFSSGSTGADGALDLSTGACQRQIQLPESGILNYTTINIPTNCSLSFKPNFRNTPVIMLAQGSVNIMGAIYLTGNGGQGPGPGGYPGGVPGQNGFGPRGGIASDVNGNDPQRNGRWAGTLSLVPIVGGSGGAGRVYDGQGGGGAIVIASSSTIVLSASSTISADAVSGNGFPGEGSGGAIRLVANSITVSGNLVARGGGQSANSGVIRLEAPAGSLTYNGGANPLPILSTTINPVIVPDGNTPSLRITSIGGFPISYTAGRPDSVDLILPSTIADPINVSIQAHNVPVGTQVRLSISGSSGATFTPGTLSGTQASSTATIPVNGLNRASASFLIASVEFNLPQSMAGYNPKGPDQIARVRINAPLGARPKIDFLRHNGTEVETAKVPQQLRIQFGQ
jgi:hypothetical protein